MADNASNWAKYLHERDGRMAIEKKDCFAIYNFMDKYCYIQEIWVAKHARGTAALPDMMDEITAIALSKGFTTLLGSVDLRDAKASQNMAIHLHYGFQVFHNDGQLTYFKLDIGPHTTFGKKDKK